MKFESIRTSLLHPPDLVRQAGIYTVSTFVGKAVPFLLLPVLTRFLSPADYGIVAMFLLVVVVLEPFVSVGLVGAITVRFFDRRTDLPAYIGTGAVLVVVSTVLFSVLVYVAREPLSELTQVPPLWLLLSVPLVVARTIGGSWLALLRVREKAVLFAVSQNLQSAGVLVLSVGLVVGLGLKWPGRVEAETLAWGGFAIVAFVALRRGGWIRFTFVAQYARELAQFGIPLIPHTLGAVLMAQTDRVLLTNLVGVGETGLYIVGYQLALVIELVSTSFNNAYAPWLFRRLTDADDQVKRRLVRYTYLQFGAMAVLAIAVAVVMPSVASIVLDPSFAKSGTYIAWFALGFFFSAMYYLVTNYIFYAQKTRWLAAVTISVAVINIPLTYVLIEVNGGVGAAQAMAISLGLSFLFTWFVSQRVYPMPWFDRRMLTTEPAE